MGFFSKFEGKMEDTFEGAAGKMQKSPISPVQIMKKAEKQMRREKVVSAGKQFAPTLYTVLVNPDDDQRLFGFYPTLAGECETRLASSAANEGLSMDGHPLVRFIVDDGLKHGKFDVIAEVVSAPIVAQLRAEEMQRYGMANAGRNAAHPQNAPAQPTPYEPAGEPQAFAAQGRNADAFPDFQEAPAAKPPLPYVPENEIDYSIDYGEYTFDSKNFEDYRDNADEAQHGAHAAHARVQAPAAPAEGAYAPQGFGAHGIPDPAQPYAPQAGDPYGAARAYQPQPAAAVQNPAAYPPAGRNMQAPAYGATPHTVAFTAGAAQANPVANGAAVRARLIDANSNRSYDLATSRVLVGRETGNDIVLNDLNVSRQHAQVAFEPRGVWVITDLGSTNGTFVNGMPVSRRGLADGDRIALGMTELVFSLR